MRLKYIFRTLLAMSVYHICALTIANNALNAMNIPSNAISSDTQNAPHIEDYVKNPKNDLQAKNYIYSLSTQSTPIYSFLSDNNNIPDIPPFCLGIDSSYTEETSKKTHTTSITTEKSDDTTEKGGKLTANVSIVLIKKGKEGEVKKSKSEPDLSKYQFEEIPISDIPTISNPRYSECFFKPSLSVDYNNETPKILSVITKTTNDISEAETPKDSTFLTNEELRKDSDALMAEEAKFLIEKKKKEINFLKNFVDTLPSPISCKAIINFDLSALDSYPQYFSSLLFSNTDRKHIRLVILMRHGVTRSNSEQKTAGKQENIELAANLEKALLLHDSKLFTHNNTITSTMPRTQDTACLIIGKDYYYKSTPNLNELDSIKPNKDKESVITTFVQQLTNSKYLDSVRKKGDLVIKTILKSAQNTGKSEDIVLCISHNSAIFSFYLQSWLDTRGNNRQLMENMRDFTTSYQAANLNLLHMENLASFIIAINCKSQEYMILNNQPIAAEELVDKLPKLKKAFKEFVNIG